jgi:hypothetical protein
MKNIVLAISALPAFCFVLFLAGCLQQPPWHLNARKVGDTVQLCLSNESTCPQENGISLGDISVVMIPPQTTRLFGTHRRKAQSSMRESVESLHSGSHQKTGAKITPPALVCGKAYLVNPGANFFALTCDGAVVVFDFQHLEEFFRQAALPVPMKKRN